ncbi:hypothetical protein ACTSKR_15375 [Chitinibacteraceae bacterium HSL-7]
MKPPSPGWLMRQLSDLETGHIRQWYWLELASGTPATSGPRWLGWLLRHGDIWLAWHWVRALPGARIYQNVMGALLHKLALIRQDSWLLAMILGASLAGLNQSAPVQVFVVSLAMVGGTLCQLWRAPLATPRSRELPGSEECISIAGALMATGTDATTATALSQALRRGEVPDALFSQLPELTHRRPTASRWRLMCMVHWLLPALVVTLSCALLPAPWGVLPALAIALLSTHGGAPKLLLLLATLLAFALGLIVRLAAW